MNDDFAGDVTTDGRYQVNGNPLLISSDFFEDSDWFLVSGFRKFYDYRITVFLPPDGLDPIFGDVNVGVYDADGNTLRYGRQAFRTQHDYTHAQNSGSRFVGISAQRVGHYRTQVLEADITGDTRQSSRVFQPNFGQRHAGSITAADDVDMFRVFLRAGKNYQIDLLGSASNAAQGSTLGDPKLQLFNSFELIAEDDNSGSGNNARIFFEPEVTGNYYLNVSGNGTQGTYLLGIPNLDDHVGSTASEARLQLGQSRLGRSDWLNDEDWFRFNMDAGFTYEFFASNTSGVQLYNQNGNKLTDSANGYQSPIDQDVFVSVTGSFSSSSDIDYRITPAYKDDFPQTTFGDARPLSFGDTIGAIEDNEDSDLFRLGLEKFGFYDIRLEAFGNRRLADAQLTTYDTEGNLLQTYNNGSTIRLRAFGQATDPAYVLVNSANDNIGAWKLNQSLRDLAGGNTSTSWNVQFIAGRGFVRNSIDFNGDEDFHRVSLRADTWYELDSEFFNADLLIRRPSGTEVNFNELVSNGDKSYFYSTQNGDHYLVARDPTSDVPKPRGYSMSIRQNAAYKAQSRFETSEWFNSSDVAYRFRGLPLEVYSEVPLQAGDLTIQPRLLTDVTAAQWSEISVADSIERSGDVYVRGVFGNGLKQDWSRIRIADVELTPEIVTENFDDYVSFDFADTLPAEYADDPMFDSFEPLTADEKVEFRNAAFRWRDMVSVNLISGGSNPDMQVFKVDLGEDQPLLSYAPGEGRGYDVILNSTSSMFQSRTPEGTYRLLQAIGTGIGMQVSDAVDRHTSVMGTRVEFGLEDVYPTTPMVADRIMTLQNTVTNTTQSGDGQIEFVRINGDGPLAMALFATDRSRSTRYSITATGSSGAASISLQRGERSTYYTDTETDDYRVIENGPDAILQDAYGGFGVDNLYGNDGNNRLAGFGGSDILIGGSGNDRLEGGRGDDFYDFLPASHQDVIKEASPTADGGNLPAGGHDVIRIFGRYDYNSIQEDITFSRLGNDLLIRLELDGRFNVNGDGIRVTNMHDPEQRVESLSLFQDGQFVEQVSLVSVFDQAVASRGRFELLGTNDGFGSLAQPV